MLDLYLLITPIILGWCVSIVWEAILGIDPDVRWNHLLSSGQNPRRVKPAPCVALDDISTFGWEWDEVVAALEKEKELVTCQ